MTARKRLSHAGRLVAASTILASVILGLLTSAHAQAVKRPEAPPPVDAAVSNGMNDASNPSHELMLDLQQMHLTNCAAPVSQAMTFLFEGSQAHFVAQPLGPDSDRWPAVFTVESIPPTGGHTHLSTLMIAPNCSGMYEQVIYWSQPCDIVKSTIFVKFTGEHVLTRDVKVSDSGPAIELYLTPAGAGCVSVKKELFR
jgi:hypothetical protein